MVCFWRSPNINISTGTDLTLQSVMANVCLCIAGKLGHGDTNRVYRPKVVEALHGFIIRKVCAGSQSSLALTSAGQV